MDVFVNRYRVRHNGIVYGPGQPGGQLIEGLSEEEGTLLIEPSNGSVTEYTPPTKGKKQNKGETPEAEEEAEDDLSGEINADDLIKPSSTRKGK